jgi:hypothetical protein
MFNDLNGLIEQARFEGNGDMLDGLENIGKELGLYPQTMREDYCMYVRTGKLQLIKFATA